MKLAPLALFLAISSTTLAQQTFTDPANLRGERVKPRDGRELPIDQGALGLQQLLRKLNTRASILNIVAHPDDEDGGMLTLYARGLGARVADLSLTRGEGGQNAMTGDFEDALGLLRTQELLANDRYTGVDQMFGTEVDFGFSKTKEEAFAKWTHDRVLYDAVRAIRLYRPLVITATFIGGVTDGHGQHQVSGQIAQEAFLAAADPKVFPDMIAEGILPWQALRVYARVPMGAITNKGLYDYATNQFVPAKFTNYVTGEVTTTAPSADVIVHEGATDLLLADENGKLRSYVQFARIGLGQQKSQIGDNFRIPSAGAFDVPYHLYGSKVPPTAKPADQANFFDGIDTSLLGIASLIQNPPNDLRARLIKINLVLSSVAKSFDIHHPDAIAGHLAEVLTLLSQTINYVENSGLSSIDKANVLHELHVKHVQFNEALVLALGLSLDATTHDANQPVASRPVVSTGLSTTTAMALTVKHEWLANSDGATNDVPDQKVEERRPELTNNRSFSRTLSTASTFTYAATRPYFDRDTIESPVYRLHNPTLRNAPATPAAITAWAVVGFRGLDIDLGRIVHSGPQPFNLVPAVSIALDPRIQVLPEQVRTLNVRAHIDVLDNNPRLKQLDKQPGKPQIVQGKIFLQTPQGWTVHPSTQTLDTPKSDFSIVLSGSPGPGPFKLTAEADTTSGEHYTEGFRPVGYGDLPRTNFYLPATLRVTRTSLSLPTHHKFAYLPGTGDAVPEALASIGLAPTLLTVADLTPANLAQYDAVILGVRTYSAHPDLHGAPTRALLDYARNGGNVLVQYQSTEFTAADAPYPLSLGSNEKVVDETAPVSLLDPASPLLTTPNKITPADFNNWIEERGHGFLSTWDPHYTALTETHDPGQADQRGGLITTPLGKGRWTYVAFALYRQLPEAVPGAYRLFLNLLNR